MITVRGTEQHDRQWLESEDRRAFAQLVAGVVAASVLPPPLEAVAAPISVRVDRDRRLGRLAAFAFGFSMEKHLIGQRNFFSPSNEQFIGCCRVLGEQVFRIGGSHMDQVTWDPTGRGGDGRHTCPADVSAFAEFVKAVGWRVIYGLNLANGTPDTTAAEGKVVADALGDALIAFEIGNEPNLYVRHGLRPAGYDFPEFLAEWQAHARALRAAVANARISGPGAFNRGWKRFGIPFANELGRSLFMLTSHYYCANGKQPGATLQELLDDLPRLYDEVSTMVAAARNNGIPAGFRMVETNTFFGGGADGISDAAVSALWALEYGLRAAELGATGLNFQLGPASHSNTALAIAPGRVAAVRPEFYGLAMLAQLGQGDMLETAVTATPPGLTAHAVGTREGRVDLVLVNLTDQAKPDVQIATGQASQLETLWLRTRGLAAKQGITLGGAVIGTRGADPAHWDTVANPSRGGITMDVPAASAVCLRMSS